MFDNLKRYFNKTCFARKTDDVICSNDIKGYSSRIFLEYDYLAYNE